MSLLSWRRITKLAIRYSTRIPLPHKLWSTGLLASRCGASLVMACGLFEESPLRCLWGSEVLVEHCSQPLYPLSYEPIWLALSLDGAASMARSFQVSELQVWLQVMIKPLFLDSQKLAWTLWQSG